jgi:hypothetical protein
MSWYKSAQNKRETVVDRILQEGLNQPQQHLHNNPVDAEAMLDAMVLEGGNNVGTKIFTIKLTPEQQSKLIKGKEPGEVILQEPIPPSQIRPGWGDDGEGIYYHCTFDAVLDPITGSPEKMAQTYPSIAIAAYNNYGELVIIFEGVRREVYENVSPDTFGYLKSLLSHKNFKDAAILIDGLKKRETEEDRNEMLTELYDRGYLK